MDYESQGKIKIRGCAAVGFADNFILLFPEGSRAFVKHKAIKGKIESVVIKKYRRMLPQNLILQGIQPEIMYEDTLNRVWAEEELISQSSAVSLYNAYNEEMQRLKEELDLCIPIKLKSCS